MNNTVIIIPSRLGAKRFPNKPLAEINGLPMIVHCLNRAIESKIGEAIVATPDQEIVNVVKKNRGDAILTKFDHTSGSDRIYEVYKKNFSDKADLIINLQGDMPNIDPNAISKLEEHMRSNNSDIGTLASNLEKNDINNPNVVKVHVEKDMTASNFLVAKDFFRTNKDLQNKKIYHHIGIYAFTNDALTKYVKLSRSKLEINRNLEQMRAMENNMMIKVGLSDSKPLGVDTKESLEKVALEMKLL